MKKRNFLVYKSHPTKLYYNMLKLERLNYKYNSINNAERKNVYVKL